MSILYKQGDVLTDDTPGRKILCHVVNNQGGWGKGFVITLSTLYPIVEKQYRAWHKLGPFFELGRTQFVMVSKDSSLTVANMLCQDRYHTIDNLTPLRYDALRSCLKMVEKRARIKKFVDTSPATVIGPKFGSGLAGGDWDKIAQIVEEELCNKGIPVVIYSL